MFLFFFLTDNQQKNIIILNLSQKFKFCISIDIQNIIPVTSSQLLRNFIIRVPLREKFRHKKSPAKGRAFKLVFQEAATRRASRLS